MFISRAGNVIVCIDLVFKLSVQCVLDTVLDAGDVAVQVTDNHQSYILVKQMEYKHTH